MADVNVRQQLTSALKKAAADAKAERAALESKQLVEEGTFTVEWMNKNE